MKLSKSELKRLRTFQLAKECPPTTLHTLWRLRMLWLVMSILTLIAYWISPSRPLACFIVGFGSGGLWCIWIFALILPRLWRLTREILNWNRIEELIKEHDDEGT